MPVLYGLDELAVTELSGVLSEELSGALSEELSELLSDEEAEEELAIELEFETELEYTPVVCDEPDELPISDCPSEDIGVFELLQPEKSAATAKNDNNTKGFFFKYHLPLVQFPRP